MMTIYKLIEANLFSVWYFYELLPEIIGGILVAAFGAYQLGKEAGRKKAEQGFLKEFGEMFVEASNEMQEYIEELANLDNENNEK